MGDPTPHCPALLLLAAFSRHDAAIDWARDRAVEAFGPVADESPVFQFNQTEYYEPTMGPGLRKIFFTFARPFDAAELVEVKLQTNRWEQEYVETARLSLDDVDDPRPLNLDPGYLTLGKLVLASTKDFAHRIYLAKGIYAEVTLYYRHHRWQAGEWTFADYRRPEYHEFFSRCRKLLRQRK